MNTRAQQAVATKDTGRNSYSCTYLEGPGKKNLCLMVDATNNCQLDCRYCYYGKKGGSDMNTETAFAACRNVADVFSGRLEDVNIHYMGGEPLLAWHRILDLNARAKNHFMGLGIPFKWSMTSNLVSLTEKKAEHMVREGASIHCSIDGPSSIQDHNRPFKNGKGSFDYVVKAIPLALQINPHDTARVTVCPNDAEKMPEIAHEVLGRGFKVVGLFPASGDDWTPDRVEGWQRGISDAFDSVRKAYGKAKQISTVIRPIHRNTPPRQKKFGYCGAGKGLWGIGINGGLYFCHHMTNRPELAIIDAAHSSPEEIRAAIEKSAFPPSSFSTHLQCQGCPALAFCNGGCWSDNFLINGSATAPSASDCSLRVATVQAIGTQMYVDPPRSGKLETCGRCYDCQRSDQSCVSCDNPCQSRCQSCDTCQRCDTCESSCEKSCQRCDSCQSRCESSCQSSCESRCQSCDRYEPGPDICTNCDRD